MIMGDKIFELFGYAPAVFLFIFVIAPLCYYAISWLLKIREKLLDTSGEITKEADGEDPCGKEEKKEVLPANAKAECQNDLKKGKYNPMTRSELERYAIMCNAAIEHEEEMEQYKEFFEAEADDVD